MSPADGLVCGVGRVNGALLPPTGLAARRSPTTSPSWPAPKGT